MLILRIGVETDINTLKLSYKCIITSHVIEIVILMVTMVTN
jgi:hypothetical protein